MEFSSKTDCGGSRQILLMGGMGKLNPEISISVWLSPVHEGTPVGIAEQTELSLFSCCKTYCGYLQAIERQGFNGLQSFHVCILISKICFWAVERLIYCHCCGEVGSA